MQNNTYDQQVSAKHQKISTLLKPFFSQNSQKSVAVELFTSPENGYRMRCEFRIWHEQDDLFYVMHHAQTKQRYKVEQLAIAHDNINLLMPEVLNFIRSQQALGNNLLKQNLFQIDFLTTLSGQIIISLIYHKKLDESWIEQALALKQFLLDFSLNAKNPLIINIIGRAKGQKICLDHDYIDEKLNFANKELIYRQIENSFTQPNALINQKMLEFAYNCCDLIKNDNKDLLELYCGNGNFSIALSTKFRHILATEVSKASIEAAKFNIQANHIENLEIARLSSEEISAALLKEREFFRLKDIDINKFNFSTIFVDPPRAGIDDFTLDFMAKFPYILYISCNPISLAENLKRLKKQGFNIIKAAMFDQFPQTEHIETGVLLSRL